MCVLQAFRGPQQEHGILRVQTSVVVSLCCLAARTTFKGFPPLVVAVVVFLFPCFCFFLAVLFLLLLGYNGRRERRCEGKQGSEGDDIQDGGSYIVASCVSYHCCPPLRRQLRFCSGQSSFPFFLSFFFRELSHQSRIHRSLSCFFLRLLHLCGGEGRGC